MIARKNGSVELRSTETGALLKDIQVFEPQKNTENTAFLLNKHKKSEHIIGICLVEA